MTSPNLSPSTPSPDWPADAVPEPWVNALFEKMSVNYGARFADLWRGVDIGAVRRGWGVELRKLSPAQLRAGVLSLTDALLTPPTLPQFMAHCRQARREAVSNEPKLTDQTRASPETVSSNTERMRRITRTLTEPKEPTAEWAFKLMKRGCSRSGLPLTYEVRRVAVGAIRSGAGRKFMHNASDEQRAAYADVFAEFGSGDEGGE